MRKAFLAACLVMAIVAGSAAAAPSPVRLDPSHGLRFSLNGSVLRVGLAPQPGQRPRDARRKLWGQSVQAICSPTFQYFRAPRSLVLDTRFWPRRQKQLSFSFERDISDRVKWCLLEAEGGTDIAAVDFAVFIRVYAGAADDRRIGQELRRYLLRGSGLVPWLRQVRGIVVDEGVIAVATGLRPNRRGKRIARRICGLIQGADVADFTPGHAVHGRADNVLRSCAARRV